MEEKSARFSLGTRYQPLGKVDKVWTVTDIWRTYSSSGDLVRLRYVASHEVMGKTIVDYDVLETTIARGLVKE